MLDAGIAPEMRASSLPDWKMTSVGMLRMPYCAPRSGTSSVFTLMNRARESIFVLTSASMGAIALHGPHHGAQKSTITGTSFLVIWARNTAALTDGGANPNNGRWHFPQFIALFSLCAGMRLSALQDVQSA